jgi:hypothetical protein
MHLAESHPTSPDHISASEDAKRYGPVGAALRSVFFEDRNVDAFATNVKDSIANIEEELLAEAAKSRLRLHDNAYDLLDARDLLADEEGKLDTAEASIAEATENVAVANDVLKGHVKARQNLDQSLETLARTRALVQMFRRAEAMIATRNLHAALRMLDRLDSAVISAQDGDVLLDVVPSSAPLRAEIAAHVRRSLHAWITAVRTEIPAIGAHALSLAHDDVKSGVRTASSATVSAASAGADGPVSEELEKSTWVPRTGEDDRGAPAGAARRIPRYPAANAARPRGSQEAANYASAPPGGVNSGAGRSRRGDPREETIAPPVITMRPLLACLLVCGDMDRMAEFAEDYERERTNQLGAGIDSIMSFNALAKTRSETDPVKKLAEQHSALVAYVAGFFVSECAVEVHSDVRLLRDDTAVELWRFARDKIVKLGSTITGHAESSMTRHVRKTETALARLASMYNLDDLHA